MREAIIKFWPPEVKPNPTFESFASRESWQNFLHEANNHQYFAANVDQNTFYDRFANGITFALSNLVTGDPMGKVIAEVFELVAEPHLTQPHIIYDFPLAVSPLSKKKPDEPDWVERFEFYIGGFEVGNAFSELNDPVDQLARFEQQMTEKDRGDNEAMDMDEDYVRALGYGLPPTAGEGIGIDRLTMLLTNSKSIRDVILFPLLRPQTKQAESEETKDGVPAK